MVLKAKIDASRAAFPTLAAALRDLLLLLVLPIGKLLLAGSRCGELAQT